MRQPCRTAIALSGAFFLLASLGYGQSLGDVARQTRQKQQAKDAHAPTKKVVTNEDIPELPDSSSDSSSKTSGNSAEGDQSSSQPTGGLRSAEQWKSAIKAQKDAIADYQRQIDKLNDSIHYVQANLYTNGVQYNQYQAKKQEEVAQAQKTLAEQKKKLEDMQEQARKEGFGSAVYDP